MYIVGSTQGGIIACEGSAAGENGEEALTALSLDPVKGIAARFNQLNPYDPSQVREILKIEDISFADPKTDQPHDQLFGYAISSKQYALYSRSENNISVLKASGHGLGYLFAPVERKKKQNEEQDE